ncbi:TPA: hypothetical protein ACGGEF_000304 [Escherichia coli]|uniref:hypothetical protein n=1 Tax=Citrobacter koseri TaxID=545 RepID=UPI0007678F45|nr:hypothetical protein [Citrobacter koseri]EAN2305683.1 hypothetical protein [Salmonella enterica]EDR4398022.1 hypothetical protein [Salmonella enterica subsp. houtenae serovar 44:z4,z23:-]EDU0294604.1 hypothetical protein [Salmonella enterica subsp. enterica serovar Monschaui]EAO5176708.1 hypothetical protein [Salmonella enterica]EBE8952249.1 hypothetical protein [Salmonella enterica]
MFNVIVTVTYHFSGTARRFALPERFTKRECAEKAAQRVNHTSYLDDGATRIVTHVGEVVEVRHV